jgi:hypothetical protein
MKNTIWERAKWDLWNDRWIACVFFYQKIMKIEVQAMCCVGQNPLPNNWMTDTYPSSFLLSISMLTMVPIEQPYPQDTCGTTLSGFLWGWQKVDLEFIIWRSSDLHQIASSSLSYYVYVILSPKILLLSLLLFPKLSTLVDCCLRWAAQRMRALCMSMAAHHHHVVVVQLL